MGGHPAIETPTLSWGNSDGNTDTYIPSPFDTEMAIDLVYKLAVDFVENQCH